jgi:hypothetical protein
MIRVNLDKIASAAKNAPITHDAYISEDIVAQSGYVVAVKILTDKAVYNQLENVEGRMTRLKPGDVIAGVLGHRRALRGYVGDVPDTLAVGDTLHVLNLGGVVGRCSSYAPDVGKPFEAELLGAVLHFPYLGERVGVPACITDHAIPGDGPVQSSAPIIAVVGTCMNAGKTVAACEIIHGLVRRGRSVAAGKLTGVALQRDVLGMLDHGAIEALSFVDAGVVTTDPASAPESARRIVTELNRSNPDAIVLEFGDGLLGEYGVQAILSTKDVARRIGAVVLCATDPVGAWGGARLLREEYGMAADLVTGPATDNEVGGAFIQSSLGVATANALNEPERLVELVWNSVFESGRDDA